MKVFISADIDTESSLAKEIKQLQYDAGNFAKYEQFYGQSSYRKKLSSDDYQPSNDDLTIMKKSRKSRNS